MDHSSLGFPVLHLLPEFPQTPEGCQKLLLHLHTFLRENTGKLERNESCFRCLVAKPRGKNPALTASLSSLQEKGMQDSESEAIISVGLQSKKSMDPGNMDQVLLEQEVHPFTQLLYSFRCSTHAVFQPLSIAISHLAVFTAPPLAYFCFCTCTYCKQ